MESQLQDALGRVADGEWWQEEAERLAGELERGRKTLNAALESVEIMKSDKLELGEQIADLIRRFKSAESSLVQTSHELETVTKALESTSAELMRFPRRIAPSGSRSSAMCMIHCSSRGSISPYALWPQGRPVSRRKEDTLGSTLQDSLAAWGRDGCLVRATAP